METTEEVKTIRQRDPKPDRMQKALDYPLMLRRERLKRSLYDFIQYFWPVVSNDEFRPNWHIKQLCSELETLAYRVSDNLPKQYDLITNIPPGTTKTITCSIMFPAWCWTKWYWMRFITASYSAALSLESAEYCRDLIRSDMFQQLYPEIGIKDDKDTKSNFKVVKKIYVSQGHAPRLEPGGNRYSTSVGGTLTGFHGHILIVDDPLNPEQAVSEKELQTANRWMEQTLPTRKVDKEVSVTILIMQRLHQDDPSGRWLENKELKTRLICLPGEIRDYRDKVYPKEFIKNYRDDLLDPVRLSWIALKELKARLGQYGYAGQVGQDPTPPGGGMFKVNRFIVINVMPNPVNITETVRYWDKAGTTDAGAYTVGVKMHRWSNRWLIEDVVRGQWSAEDRERMIRSAAEVDGRNVKVYVEQEPGSGGKESAEATVHNLAGYACYKDRPTGDKIYRADPLSVQVNDGNVVLLKGEWNHDFVEEFRYFPFSTYKDQVDAASGAFSKLTVKRYARRIT